MQDASTITGWITFHADGLGCDLAGDNGRRYRIRLLSPTSRSIDVDGTRIGTITDVGPFVAWHCPATGVAGIAGSRSQAVIELIFSFDGLHPAVNTEGTPP